MDVVAGDTAIRGQGELLADRTFVCAAGGVMKEEGCSADVLNKKQWKTTGRATYPSQPFL